MSQWNGGGAEHAAPTPKKKHTVRNVILTVFVLGVLAVGGCMALVVGAGNEVNKQSNTEHAVTYKVTGTSKKGSVTYNTDGGTTMEQANEAKLPWSKVVKVKGLVTIVQVSAQNGLGEKGKITCTIELDGKVVKTATATGEGAIASCDHTL